MKPGGKLALTTNLNGHWQIFYDIFEQTLKALGEEELIEGLLQHQQHHGSGAGISEMFAASGFTVTRRLQEHFHMSFLDGWFWISESSFRKAWLGSWKALIPEEGWTTVFPALEDWQGTIMAVNRKERRRCERFDTRRKDYVSSRGHGQVYKQPIPECNGGL